MEVHQGPPALKAISVACVHDPGQRGLLTKHHKHVIELDAPVRVWLHHRGSQHCDVALFGDEHQLAQPLRHSTGIGPEDHTPVSPMLTIEVVRFSQESQVDHALHHVHRLW